MKIKLIFDSGDGCGVTTNQEPLPDQFAVEMDEADIGWFTKSPRRYRHVDGVFGENPDWQAEQVESARLAALNDLKQRIVYLRKEKNDAIFSYLGVQYVSDEPNILGVKSQIEGLPDSDPIPTFTGTTLSSTWATAEGAFTPFTCGEFRAFAAHYYAHREKNFTNYTLLTIAAYTAYQAGAAADDLAAFDISEGWD